MLGAFLDVLKLLLIVFYATGTAHAGLKLSQFTYEAGYEIGAVGAAGQGLAYREKSDTWFTVSANGNAPFVVKEFRFNPANGGSVPVRDWGALNADGRLNVVGNVVGCRGLLYDESLDGLWCNFGSWYALGNNNNFLCFARLDYTNKTWRIEGPWRVNAAVHSDTVKGKMDYMPATGAGTGYGLVCFGERGSTAQLQSWGPGVVFVGGTSNGLPIGELAAKRVVHWPLIMFSTDDGIYGRSDFECDKSLTLITGPVTSPTFTTWNYLSQADGFTTMCVVDDALVFTGNYGEGYSWYGTADKYAALNLDSLLWPGQKMKSVSTARGIHVEGHRPKIILLSFADVMEAYRTGNQKVKPYETGNIQTLGGVVPMKTTTFTGTFFNKKTRKFYGIEVAAPNRGPIVRQWNLAL